MQLVFEPVRGRCARALVTALVLWSVAGCATTALQVASRPEWIEVRSEHFTLMSLLPPDRTRDIARELEVFRAAVLLFTTVSEIPTHHPTLLYVFDGDRSFGPFSPDSLVKGYMLPSIRANVLTITETKDLAAQFVIKHEFTHMLLRNGTSVTHPMWFDEGFADFMSTVAIEDGVVWIGEVPDHRIEWLKYSYWMPLGEVLDPKNYAARSRERKAMFYAVAWAYVHQLMTDAERRSAFNAAFPGYIEATGAGVPVAEAFESSFGKTVDDADAELIAYLRSGRLQKLGTDESRLEWSSTVSGRRLGEAEVAVRLGTLEMLRNRPEKARGLFERALELAPDDPRAHAGLGDALEFAGDFDAAQPWFERAVKLGPDDPLNHIDLGEYWLDRAATEEDVDERTLMLRRARRAFVRANGMAPDLAEPYGMYGATFLFDGEDASKSLDSLHEAARLLPSDDHVRWLLAEAYLRTGRREDALALARAVLVGRHASPLTPDAVAMLEALERGELQTLMDRDAARGAPARRP